MADKVSILKRDGSKIDCNTYGNARINAVSGDLIQIWATLNEQIILKNGVDIWIAPGVEINNTSGETITDKVNSVSQEVHCKIYGFGKIKNTGGYSCLFLDVVNSEITVDCNSFDTSTVNSTTIYITRARKFHLFCKSILSKGSAIYVGYPSGNIVEDIRLNIGKVETGDTSSSPIVGTSIVTYANGFININEIICKNYGHCLLHRKGSITARIYKMTGVRVNSGLISTILVGQGDGNQKLVLYFDEIQHIRGNGSSISADTIEITQGTGFLIGRRVFSNDGYGVAVTQPLPPSTIITFANLKCCEIESFNFAGVFISDVTNETIVDSDTIRGYGVTGAVYGQGKANLLLKNTMLRNRDTTSNSRCLTVEMTNSNIPSVTLNNIKAVTNNITSGSIIFQAGFNGLTVKNFGLFANKVLDEGITLSIGEEDNFQFIESSDLT
jgi:hypothetical protein